MEVKCFVCCINASGEPDLFVTTVICSQEDYNNGEHCEMARKVALDERYEDPMIVADENDCLGRTLNEDPKFLVTVRGPMNVIDSFITKMTRDAMPYSFEVLGLCEYGFTMTE